MEQRNGTTDHAKQDSDFAKAWAELQRGESAATALENHLDSVEKRIEELLKNVENLAAEGAAGSGDKPPKSEGDNSSSKELEEQKNDEKTR